MRKLIFGYLYCTLAAHSLLENFKYEGFKNININLKVLMVDNPSILAIQMDFYCMHTQTHEKIMKQFFHLFLI